MDVKLRRGWEIDLSSSASKRGGAGRVDKLLTKAKKALDKNLLGQAYELYEQVLAADVANSEAFQARSNIKSQVPASRIFVAVRSGDEKMLADVLAINPTAISARGDDYQTPLHVAVKTDRADMVNWLINAGAEVDARDLSGQTPLHVAVRRGKKSLVKFLIGHGADPGVKDNQGRTALDLAQEGRRRGLLKLLKKSGGH